jgi:uncharacterized iron-regulated membrane protein
MLMRMGRMRRLLCQVHLWVGLATGLYILIVSLSGSLIVFRRELDRALCPGTLVVSPSGRRFMSVCELAYITWLAEFHDHLAAGRTGLWVNGLGAVAVMLMCITGAIIWWPGRSRWQRSIVLRRGVSARRFIRDLHNVLGFWLLLLLAMWAITGIYFAFPDPFNALVDRLTVGGASSGAAESLEDGIAWLVRLHFGRAFGLPVETLWVILGLAPCGLFVTGGLMWWNRVWRSGAELSPAARSPRWRAKDQVSVPAADPPPNL